MVRQVEHYLDNEKRLSLARKFVEGAIHNFKRNIEKEDSILSVRYPNIRKE